MLLPVHRLRRPDGQLILMEQYFPPGLRKCWVLAPPVSFIAKNNPVSS